MEEQRLRQKLHELTDNISDHSLTSDEEESSRPEEDARPSRLPIRPASRASIVVSRLEEERPEQTDSEQVQKLHVMPERTREHIWIVAPSDL